MTQRVKSASMRNDRIIAVPSIDEETEDVADLPEHVHRELERFFTTIGELTDKKIWIEGWEGRKVASRLVERAALAYAKRCASEEED